MTGELERLRAALERIRNTIAFSSIKARAIDEVYAIANEALADPSSAPDDRLDLLTDRQREVFEFIQSEVATRRHPPTVREIGARFGISSPNGVSCHLRAIRKKGLICWDEGMSRTLAVVTADSARGRSAAGEGRG